MTTTNEPQKHVKMPDEPLEIDEEDFYVRAFIKWAIEEQPKVKRLEAENAELREELAKWERLIASINLPDYPVSQFVPKDLERENAKLRELVRFANKTVEGLCEMVENSPGCFMCSLNQDEDKACGAAELYNRMCELGVEYEYNR